MEAVAILGVVGNAIQLVDFTTKLISKSRSLQQSGSLVEQKDLLTVSEDLSQLSGSLKRNLDLSPPGNTENDSATRNICEKCLEIGLEIQTALADNNKKSSCGKWKSFRHAFKAMWGAEKLAEMQGRLIMFSQQLQQRTQMKTHEAVTGMHVEVIRALKDTTISPQKEHEATRSDMQALKDEAEKQAHQLQEEIKTLRLDLEKRIAESIIKSEQLSKAEQNRIHEFTNATYKLWAAKEVMLTNISASTQAHTATKANLKLQSTIAGLREATRSRSAHSSKIEAFKVHAYPPGSGTREQNAVPTRSSTQTISCIQEDPQIRTAPLSPLWDHIATGNVQELAACLAAGADANAQCIYISHNTHMSAPCKITPLIAALLKGGERVEMIEMLLKHGADLNGCESDVMHCG